MTDKKSPSDKPTSGKPGSGTPTAGKKPHATIDLKATEVKSGETDKAKPTSVPGTGGSSTAAGGPAKSTATAGTSSVEATPGAAKDAKSATAAATGAKPDEKKTDDKKPGATTTAAPGASAASAAGGSAAMSGGKSTGGKADDSLKSGGSGSNGDGGRGKAGAAPPPPRRSGGGIGSIFSHLAAGLVGGFVMLLGADALQPQLAEIKTKLGLPETADNSGQVAELQTRLAALEQKTGETDSTAGQAQLEQQVADAQTKLAELESLKGELAQLKEQQSSLEAKTQEVAEQAASGGGDGEAVPEQRIARLEQQLEAMTSAAKNDEGSGFVPKLAALTGRMADLEQTLKTQIDSVRASVSQDVGKRIEEIETSSEAARSGTQRIDRQLSGVANDTARLGQQLETVKADMKRLGDTLRALQEETATVSSRLSGFEGDVTSKIGKLAGPDDISGAVSPVADQVQQLASRVENVVAAEKDRKENAKRIVLTLELANLERAIERGESFSNELAQVKQTADGLLDLSKLEQFDTSGVASISKLQEGFRPVAHQIIEATDAPSGDSVFDQLLANARSVVKVRKVNHADGDTSPEAIVARIEDALASGRLGEVIGLAEKLPESGQQAAGDWLAKVRDRNAVDVALASVSDQLKASLSGASSETN